MMEDTDPPRRHGQLREEAADWFAIMRNPEEAEAKRKEFEAWLARGALHRAAYNRIAEAFSNGKRLKEPSEEDIVTSDGGSGDDIRRSEPRPKAKKRAVFLLALLGTVALVAYWASGQPREELKHPSLAVGTAPGTSDGLVLKLAVNGGAKVGHSAA